MTAKTFTTTSVHSAHGTRKAAQAQADRYNRGYDSTRTYTVEHTGPRLFSVIRTEVITSEPKPVREIMSGQQIVCSCGSEQWFYTGRSLFSLDYTCAGCAREISPVSETGASQ